MVFLGRIQELVVRNCCTVLDSNWLSQSVNSICQLLKVNSPKFKMALKNMLGLDLSIPDETMVEPTITKAFPTANDGRCLLLATLNCLSKLKQLVSTCSLRS